MVFVCIICIHVYIFSLKFLSISAAINIKTNQGPEIKKSFKQNVMWIQLIHHYHCYNKINKIKKFS